MPIARTTLETFVSPDELKDVILDFEAYPEMMKEVTRVDVHERSDTHALCTFHLDISFAGFKLQSHYKVRYTIADDRIEWSLVESPTLTKNRGFWLLEATDDDECVAKYEAEIELNLPIPPEVQAAFTEQELPKLMGAIRDRAEG